MTPERLQEIRDRSHRDNRWTRSDRDRLELLNYINLLHEDLRLTREERDQAKHQTLEHRKEAARMADAYDALTEYVRRLEHERAECWKNHRADPIPDSKGHHA